MARVRTVVTGVAGSPYYVQGYFTGPGGSVQDKIDAWHTFVTGGLAATQELLSDDCRYETESFVPLVDSATGSITGFLTGTNRVTNGTGTAGLLPTSNQVLVRWRTGVYIGGREVRGHTNLPAQTIDAQTVNGDLKPSFGLLYEERADALAADEDAAFVVWSKKNGVYHRVFDASVWSKFAVLRSRRD